MVVQICNLSTWEVDRGGSGTQSLLRHVSEANQGYVSLYLKNKSNTHNCVWFAGWKHSTPDPILDSLILILHFHKLSSWYEVCP